MEMRIRDPCRRRTSKVSGVAYPLCHGVFMLIESNATHKAQWAAQGLFIPPKQCRKICNGRQGGSACVTINMFSARILCRDMLMLKLCLVQYSESQVGTALCPGIFQMAPCPLLCPSKTLCPCPFLIVLPPQTAGSLDFLNQWSHRYSRTWDFSREPPGCHLQ